MHRRGAVVRLSLPIRRNHKLFAAAISPRCNGTLTAVVHLSSLPPQGNRTSVATEQSSNDRRGTVSPRSPRLSRTFIAEGRSYNSRCGHSEVVSVPHGAIVREYQQGISARRRNRTFVVVGQAYFLAESVCLSLRPHWCRAISPRRNNPYSSPTCRNAFDTEYGQQVHPIKSLTHPYGSSRHEHRIRV